MGLYMETTKIPAEKTAGQIVQELVAAGASQIGMQYESKRIVGLKFSLEVPKRGILIFVLPARTEPVFRLINGRRKYSYDRTQKEDADRVQAERVAWRQLYRWVQAQVALIQTGMVDAGEVFFPYAQDESGKTVWERVLSGSTQLALPPAPSESNIREFKK